MKKKNKISFIRTMVLLFFGSLALGQFQRIQLTPDTAFYVHDLLLGVIYISTIFVRKKAGVLSRKYKLPLLAFLLFSLSLSLSLVLWVGKDSVDIVQGSLYLFRYIFYALSLPAFYILRKTGVISKSLLYPLLAMGVGLMVTGLVQRVFIPDTRNFTLLGWDNHLYRSIGSLLDPNFLGLMLVLSLVLAKNIEVRKKPAILGLLILTLLLTYSRSSYLSFIAAFSVLGMQKSSKKVVAFAISIIFIGALLLPRPGGEGIRLERTASISSRLSSQMQALDIFSTHKVFGIGFNNYKSFVSNPTKYNFVPSHPSGPDNSFLLILITTGIVGSSLFLVLCYFLYKAYSTHPIVLPSLAAVFIHSMFNNSLFYPWVLLWIYILFVESVFS